MLTKGGAVGMVLNFYSIFTVPEPHVAKKMNNDSMTCSHVEHLGTDRRSRSAGRRARGRSEKLLLS